MSLMNVSNMIVYFEQRHSHIKIPKFYYIENKYIFPLFSVDNEAFICNIFITNGNHCHFPSLRCSEVND